MSLLMFEEEKMEAAQAKYLFLGCSASLSFADHEEVHWKRVVVQTDMLSLFIAVYEVR